MEVPKEDWLLTSPGTEGQWGWEREAAISEIFPGGASCRCLLTVRKAADRLSLAPVELPEPCSPCCQLWTEDSLLCPWCWAVHSPAALHTWDLPQCQFYL